MSVPVQIMRLPHGADLPLPAYQSEGAAGLDLLAAVPADTPVVIAPGHRASIPTGIAIALPRGVEGQVRPRSGLAARHGITVLNTPGTVDADYRGEIQVILVNFGDESFSRALLSWSSCPSCMHNSWRPKPLTKQSVARGASAPQALRRLTNRVNTGRNIIPLYGISTNK